MSNLLRMTFTVIETNEDDDGGIFGVSALANTILLYNTLYCKCTSTQSGTYVTDMVSLSLTSQTDFHFYYLMLRTKESEAILEAINYLLHHTSRHIKNSVSFSPADAPSLTLCITFPFFFYSFLFLFLFFSLSKQ
jgi:hypothetical protein